MKYIALIPLVVSCASRPHLIVRPLLPPPVEPVDSVRYGEVVRAYHVGRHVDPDHPETMHEGHPVYRIETSARWNLHPRPWNTTDLLNPPPDAAFAPPPTNDALVAEMNRQRETTARVIQQAAQLTQSYAELEAVIGELKNVAMVNARLAKAEQQIADLAKDLERFYSSPRTNEVPSSVPELTEPSKP